MVGIGTGITLGIMAFVSWYNQKKTRELTAQLKQKQQENQREIQEHGCKRAYEKFKHSCELQVQMEEDSHQERLNNIDEEFLKSFEKMAKDVALRGHYPLQVSPYVIKNSVIPIYTTQIGHSRAEVFCILTNSNDENFNNDILPILDDMLCDAISLYWNQSSMHTICYYPNIWRKETKFDDAYIQNLHTKLVTPTLTITPYFERQNDTDTLLLKFNMWGLGNKDIISSEITTNIEYKSRPKTYTTEETNNIISQIFPSLICNLGQVIDAYYWTTYYQSPLLPSLLAKGYLSLSNDTLSSYCKEYTELYNTLVLGQISSITTEVVQLEGQQIQEEQKMLIQDHVAINQHNFPERSLAFLQSILELPQEQSDAEHLITNTLLSIYKARTGYDDVISINDINVYLLDTEEMDMISYLTRLSKKYCSHETTNSLVELIRKKIVRWS